MSRILLPELVLGCPVEALAYSNCIVKQLDSSSHVTKGCCEKEFQALSLCVRAQLRARKGKR